MFLFFPQDDREPETTGKDLEAVFVSLTATEAGLMIVWNNVYPELALTNNHLFSYRCSHLVISKHASVSSMAVSVSDSDMLEV